MRSPQADPKAKNRAKVLEVSQVWGDALVDTKRFKHGRSASIGSSVVYKWSVFNVPLLNVPPPMNMVMQFVPPLGDPLGRQDQRRQVGLGEIAVVVAFFLGPGGADLAGARVVQQRHLPHRPAAFQQRHLAVALRVERALDVGEAVHVLHLGLGPEA